MMPIEEISSRTIADRLTIPANSHIILLLSTCRGATTAAEVVLASNKIPAFHQPGKTILRWEMEGEERRIKIESPNPVISIKETIGPYTPQESVFNPLEVLEEAGVTPDRITLVATMRSPLATVTSWKEQFSKGIRLFGGTDNDLVDNAITSYHTVKDIYENAKDRGIRSIALAYEALRDHPADIVLKRLFDKLELPVLNNANWNDLPDMHDPESGIHFYTIPDRYPPLDQDVHAKVRTSEGWTFFPKPMNIIRANLSLAQVSRLEQGNVFSIYDQFRRDSVRDLGLPIEPSRELANYKGIPFQRTREGAKTSTRNMDRR